MEIDLTTDAVPESRLAALYRAHATEAKRLAYLLCGDAAMAEDAVQDAFVNLAGRFRDVREPEAFPAYLRKTVVNVVRGYHRRKKVHDSWLDRRGPETATTASHDVETRDLIVRALQKLPERQRAALVLRHLADLSESATADALGCRVGTVKSLTSRGLDALREILRGEQE